MTAGGVVAAIVALLLVLLVFVAWAPAPEPCGSRFAPAPPACPAPAEVGR